MSLAPGAAVLHPKFSADHPARPLLPHDKISYVALQRLPPWRFRIHFAPDRLMMRGAASNQRMIAAGLCNWQDVFACGEYLSLIGGSGHDKNVATANTTWSRIQ